MTGEAEKAVDESVSLYISDAELHRRLCANLGRDRFRAAVREAESRGFPRIHTVWRGRNWQEVLEWVANDEKDKTDGVAATAQDGPEDFDASPGKKARPQNRPPQPAVLVRQTGVPRPDGISRHLHSVATGRDR
jgi:hypothetical protein